MSKVLLCVLGLSLLGLVGCQQVSEPVSVEVGSGPQTVELGPRPAFLVAKLPEGALKEQLSACEGPFSPQDFSIGHRGAPLMFPEHTEASFRAAALMGAGILECDVTFTRDRQLVCRHAQCDLHQTTDILLRPELAARCSEPFTPADPVSGQPASARCCTSDIDLAEYLTLCGKMDGVNPAASTVQQYLRGTADWRTDLYAGSCPAVLSHQQSIELFQQLGRKMTPELKAAEVPMPFQGHFSQQQYAQQLVDEYKAAGVPPEQVFLQSFDWQDIVYWLKAEPEFAKQAVWLDGRYEDPAFDPMQPDSWQPGMAELKAAGLNIIAPPLWVLVHNEDGQIRPSAYAKAARAAGLEIISWTLERSGRLDDGGGWYYQSIADLTTDDSVALQLLHVLAQEVGVIGVFSDWPATTTLYANCML
ncbi:glycerophosphodiester phosphodiesterase family protein [Alkalimonas delamerensis]|uniref:glycerophosphodiester phosphodiesterase n=1 Tax=Alkalimonas delamerensis TaxID=265981 RepID=A0ABT9GTQ7_9GAMM|nr:glycerophosphodiester phosphodiesterase family protein [Alkalimonas delamerensis]MDP4530357.1 glycerophosphodiester phosphodiesterase family protein [Alkalimonas delamerensis]